MARKYLVPLDLVQNELQNARMQNLGTAPTVPSPVKGQMYFNSTDNILYWYNGSGWVAAQGGAGAVPATTVTASAVGDASVVGVATTYAREDHKHSREAFANPTGTTTFGLSVVNGSAATVARSDHTHGTPTHDNAAHSAITLNSLAAPTADRSMGGFKITGLGTPAAGTDAVTKDYTDNLTAGLSWKEAVRAGSTANRALTGLTAMDGVTPSANDRILLKNQTAPAENGIWLAQSGAWTRALDADAAGEMEQATVFIMEGTTLADTAWTCTTGAPITVGTTGLTFVQFGAGTAYTAGAGLTLSTSTFDITALDASIVVAADTIAVGYAGTGAAATAARSDHNHDATYMKVFALDCAAATSTTVTHNFNTRDVHVQVYRATTPWDNVEVDIERTSANVVTVTFATAPTAAQYRIVVQGLDQ